MRIALVVTGGVDRSGTDRVIPALLSFIARLARRHRLVVYVLRYHQRPCTYSLLGATVHDLGRPEGLAAQYRALAAALERDGPFDVIHAYWAVPAGAVSVFAGRRLGIPVVVTADSGEFTALADLGYGLQRHWRHRLAVRAATTLASRVTVCTRHMAAMAARHGCRPTIVPIGVDRDVFRPAPDAEVGDGASRDMAPWRLLHVASLNPVKDQAMLLRAFAAIAGRIAPRLAHLDIAGEDTMDGAVQALAGELGVESQVRFHGPLRTSALVPLYQAADLLLVSSRHEAAMVVALEAACCGLPIVGTRVGYLADWAPDGAVTVDPGDAGALAGEATRLLEDVTRRRAIAAAARTWALAHDADWTADQFGAIYHELTRPPRR